MIYILKYLVATDNKKATALVLLDLSAAFDTIDHVILLNRLSNKLGMCGTAKKWFESYLSDRTQRVNIDGAVSDVANLPYGVPQGSVLGPILFTIYTQEVEDIAREHGVNIHLYADDTQLYISYDVSDPESSQHNARMAMSRLETCIHDIKKWMLNNKLKLNDSKTEVIIITPPRLEPCVSQVQIGNCFIAKSTHVRNLGLYLDEHLSMDHHLQKICNTAYIHVRSISGIRKYITKEACETLVHAFITSRLDYCNAALFGLPGNCIQKFQRIQNIAARIVTKTRKHDHITPILSDLHWLPVAQRIQYKILLLTYKALHDQCPVYLSDLVHRYIPDRVLRSSSQNLLKISKSRTKTFGERAFSVCAPTLWNSLPPECQHDNLTLSSFKTKLKTHLYRTAFPAKYT